MRPVDSCAHPRGYRARRHPVIVGNCRCTDAHSYPRSSSDGGSCGGRGPGLATHAYRDADGAPDSYAHLDLNPYGHAPATDSDAHASLL